MRNKQSNKYADIPLQQMSNNNPLYQWEFYWRNSQLWYFTHLGDGIYSIHSKNSTSNYYLGVSGDSTADKQAIVLRTGTLTNGMKWKVTVTESGAYKLTPLSGVSNNLVLGLDVDSYGEALDNGVALQQRIYTADSNYADEWHIFQHHPFNVSIRYDQAYLNRWGSSAETIAVIDPQLERMQEVFLENFNISVKFSTPTLYTTYANSNCTTSPDGSCSHGICTNSLTKITLSSYHHTNITNILMRLPGPSAPTSAVVLYIGHDACRADIDGHDEHPVNGLAYLDYDIIGMNIWNNNDGDARVLIHELGHLFSAPDHYGGSASTTDEINAKYGSTLFDSLCIYGEDRFNSSVIENMTICAGCQAEIRKNVDKFFADGFEYG